MLAYFIYIGLLFLELFLLMLFTLYIFLLIYSHISGSPYVPSKTKELELILSKCRLKRKMTFVDLGCGDGRVVRMAVKTYGVNGVGIDVNPLLLIWARMSSRLSKLKNIQFLKKNILTYDVSQADVIYLFLLPGLLTKLVPRLEKTLQPGTLIVSHGFKIPEWKKYLTETVKHTPFPTYFYSYKV